MKGQKVVGLIVAFAIVAIMILMFYMYLRSVS